MFLLASCFLLCDVVRHSPPPAQSSFEHHLPHRLVEDGDLACMHGARNTTQPTARLARATRSQFSIFGAPCEKRDAVRWVDVPECSKWVASSTEWDYAKEKKN
jgi:hypothetical protein